MPRKFDKIRKIDSHAHLIDKRLQKKATTKPFLEDTFTRQHGKDIVQSSKQRRIVKSLVFPLPSTALSTKRANRMILEASRNNKHLVPIAFLRENASSKEIFRYCRKGFKGFKVYSDIPEKLASSFEKAKQPIILHPPFYPSSGEFHRLINRVGRRFPIILAHFGRVRTIQEAIELVKLIKPFPNICVDTSGFVGKLGAAEYIIKALGPNRVLFGTDRPFGELKGTSLVLTKEVSSEIPQELVGQSRFLTDAPHTWNNPFLISLFKKLNLGKESIEQRSNRVLYKTLSKLLSQGEITNADVKKIFFLNARRIFKI